MKLKDLLNEIEISRGISIEVGDQIIVNGSPLKELNIATRGMSDRVYRGYLFTEDRQINLSGGQSGLDEFLKAIGYSSGNLKEFLSKYGVNLRYSEFDVS
tara:strand:- start:300 stop:599 length:300 start_codon:yes stop_codon:yes gene_type:complete